MRRFLVLSLPIFILGVIFFLITGFLNKNVDATYGVEIAGIKLHELTKSEAKTILKNKIGDYRNSNIVLIADTGAQLETSLKNINPIFDITASLDNAYSIGKNENRVLNKLKQAKAFVFGINAPLSVRLDETVMSYFVTNTLTPIHKPAKNASFIYNFDTETFNFSSSRDGFVINLNELQNKLLNRMSELSNEQIKLKQAQDKPLVENNGASEAKEYAQKIIDSEPYIIQYKNEQWQIERDDLISWIDFRPVHNNDEYYMRANISRTRVQEYLTVFAPGLNTAPINAEFHMEGTRVVAFNLATAGYTLDIANSANDIASSIENLETYASLIFIETPPEITETAIDNLEINALLGRGESNFAGSPASRKHNIQVGADKYQGILIAPGEEFSFNDTLGEVTAASGYLPELVIKRNKTIPEYGGGLCQVSTTLFRAAVYSGLEITKRSNHSYPVVYYGTPGFDATIYPPNPDLAFRNNTSGHILIQYKISGTKLTFEIYGSDDGRQTEVVGPVTYDAKPDGSIKAWLKQIVRDDNNEILFEKTFYSNFRSPALYPVDRNPLE